MGSPEQWPPPGARGWGLGAQRTLVLIALSLVLSAVVAALVLGVLVATSTIMSPPARGALSLTCYSLGPGRWIC